ncbi:MAG: DUF2235 domain-containing protein [Nostoc sp.]|uniref:DUF2235 domain-containing protein n=1 Tax=Nostoc sp. TaxID=1180 RepID=UPI002FFCB1F9
MKRRLIVCCDGTWQDLEQKCPTNVVKIAQAIKPVDDNDIDQIIYYGEGLGTKQINTKQSLIDVLTKLGGGALGLGIDHKIQDAYRFLCMNYEPNDEIYLFGFSRGAYTVRCLAGLIYNSSLLPRQFIRKIPEAYELYREKQNPDNAPNGKNAVKFRIDNTGTAEVPPIKALCCWDTVASLGLPDLIPGIQLDKKFNERYRFFDDKVNPSIEKAIHAVAIDEIRKVFDVTLMESSKPEQVTQHWFPGCHGCVGGGSNEEQGLSDGALLWMMEQVEKLGLALDRSRVKDDIKPRYDIPFDNTPKFPFNVGSPNIRKVTGKFSDLHESVKQRWQDPNCHYQPDNLMQFQEQLNSHQLQIPRFLESVH